VATINNEMLLTDEPASTFGEDSPSVVAVPVLSRIAIGLTLAVTVIFGFWPAPLTDFAHAATLLFIGH
jgi:hypothetical protein